MVAFLYAGKLLCWRTIIRSLTSAFWCVEGIEDAFIVPIWLKGVVVMDADSSSGSLDSDSNSDGNITTGEDI